ncbi:MAG TPA: GNAT family N-acetyltransferase [Anaerolineae bacterium]|jgi:phosphinothricin acetyltransferase
MTTDIRLATEADLPAILSIYNDAILNTTAVYDYTAHTLEMRQAWFAAKQRDGFPVYVAEVDGEVCGFSSFGPFRAWAAYKYSVEHSVYVAQHRRNYGVGRALILAVIDAARAMDRHVILAGIDSENEVSIRLHRKLGFVEAGTMKQVGYKFGHWLDLVFMQLILDTPERPVE